MSSLVLRFERITAGGAERVHGILAACGRDLVWRYGLSHWDPPYPLELLPPMPRSTWSWPRTSATSSSATFTLSTEETLPGYTKLFPSGLKQPVYLARLAVSPARQGAGIGAACILYLEGVAFGLGADGLRLDAVVAVPGLRDLYVRRGYREVGDFEMSGVQCALLEKRLPTS